MQAWDSNKNLFNDYLSLFQKLNICSISTDQLLRFDQIHAGGLTATKKISELINLKPSSKVLELGGGIGGVARYLAKNYNSFVINLDLSLTYSITGLKLTSMTKEQLMVFFVCSDALDIPFGDEKFNLVWMQHINMNIFEKGKLLKEIKRVLKKEGALVFHEWFIKKEGTEIYYPLPWSDSEKFSFLTTFENFINLAESIGFKGSFIKDDTEFSLNFYKKIYENRAFLNPVFKERDAPTIFENIIRLIEENKLSCIYGKLVF